MLGPVTGFLYRLRGAGWLRWFGIDKWVALLANAMILTLPAFMVMEAPWQWYIIALSVVFSTIGGRAAHGEFMTMGQETAVRNRDDNAWVGWMFDWEDTNPHFRHDFFGLMATAWWQVSWPAIAIMVMGYPVMGFIALALWCVSKPIAYTLGWFVFDDGPYEFKKTSTGEWLFGIFMGVITSGCLGWLYFMA